MRTLDWRLVNTLLFPQLIIKSSSSLVELARQARFGLYYGSYRNPAWRTSGENVFTLVFTFLEDSYRPEKAKSISHLYEFGSFRVDASRRLLLRGTEVIPLAPKVFDTLLVLVTSHGRILDKEELIRQVWDGVAVEEVGLAKNISNLRRSLGENPAQHEYIVTVPGRGYRFVAEVRSVLEGDTKESGQPERELGVPLPATGEEEVTKILPPGSQASARFRWRVAAIVLAAALGAVVVWIFYFRSRPAFTKSDTILLADFVNQTGEPVFDLTLREGLAVQLEQSPFLNIFPQERIRETLRMMRRSPDERVTQAIALEICRRQGLNALVTGLITPLGGHYAITLEAFDARSGDTLVRVQEQASGKERILAALSKAASSLREKLGESIPSVQKFDALLERTTGSLEALRAYSLGHQERMRGHFREAVLFYRRAVELDPSFAYAYAGLATLFFNMEQPQQAVEYASEAYRLRDHSSELEQFSITSFYYGLATGELDKRIEVLKLEQQSYPRHSTAYTNLASTYMSLGQFEQAVEQSRLAIRLNPNSETSYAIWGRALIRLHRFAEAKLVYQTAIREKMDSPSIRNGLFEIAFVDGDDSLMEQEITWATDKLSSGHRALEWEAGAAAYRGQAAASAEYSRRAIASADQVAAEVASEYAAQEALREAALGQCERAKALASHTLAYHANWLSLSRGALALSWCGAGGAEHLVAELSRRYPRHTLVNGIYLPEIRAAMELRRGRPEAALELLTEDQTYEAAAEFWPQYLRGQAYLQLKKTGEAAAEFRKIIDQRGQDPLSPLYPLSYFGLGRSLTLQHDLPQANKSHQQFLSEWKDADSDLPALRQAKKIMGCQD